MDIRVDLISWSFGAGVVAFFNPCGFAMLPAYVAHYLAGASGDGNVSSEAALRGLSLGGVVSGGFITVFVILGVIVSLLGGALGTYLPWVASAIGITLIALGGLMLFKNISIKIPILEPLAAQLSQSQAQSSKDLQFYYVYGITYALASTGCTFPIFMIVAGNAFSAGIGNGLIQFGAYATGMALMMILISMSMVISKEIVTKILPTLMTLFRWVGGVGVVAAGAYLVYYNLFYSGVVSL